MQRIAIVATGIVALNLLISFLHGLAHQWLGVALNPWQWTFVAVVIVVAPLVAMILYWGRFRRGAALLLFLSMIGSLIFGVYHHFMVPSPDHVAHLPEGNGQTFFIVTAILLVPVEVLGAAFGIWSWQALRKGAADPLR
jgi:hypothetical protein